MDCKKLKRASLIAGLKMFGVSEMGRNYSHMGGIKDPFQPWEKDFKEFQVPKDLDIPVVPGSGLIWGGDWISCREETLQQSIELVEEMTGEKLDLENSSDPLVDLYGDFAYIFDPVKEEVIDEFLPLELTEFYVYEAEEGIIKVTVK